MSKPPAALKVIPEAVPTELRACPQWVGWQWEWRHGKWTKVPINPKTGRRADSTVRATWGHFEQALAYMQAHDLPGIGFVFSVDDSYAGVDFDKCVDTATGEVAPDRLAMILALDSYAEYSPTGTGVKVFLKGKLPGERRKNTELGIEMYDSGRFFTVTGHHL